MKMSMEMPRKVEAVCVKCSTGQGALKGTNLRGQTEPKRRFSLIFADSRLFQENKAYGKRRFLQKATDFRREPQIFAGTCRKPQIGVCPLRFVPLSAALTGSPPCHDRNKIMLERSRSRHRHVAADIYLDFSFRGEKTKE